ncbi:MAG: tetratricopeptide repeat protein [Xanthomonadales bacterium]|nr:tetratricopeptide repeat protein [Xanthomonadales bacterium]
MANEHLDDYEQAEAVKKWLRENGGAIVMGVAIGLGGLYGWQYFQSYQVEQKYEAAAGYAALVANLEQDQPAPGALDEFRNAYGSDSYAALAGLQLAQDAVEAGDLDQAIEILRRTTEFAEPEPMRNIAGLRLARVQLAAGRHAEALASIDRWGTGKFEALGAEIRGDVLYAQGDRAGAREAYQFALNNLEAGGDRNLLQMKIDDLTAAAEGDAT